MKKFIAGPGIILLIFIVFAVMAATYNVDDIGPMDTEVGFSSLNGAMRDLLPLNPLFYDLSEYLGYLAIAAAGAFGVLGAAQMIKRKSLLKVDKKILAMGGLYVLLAAAYLLFEVVVINYRPVIMPGETLPEASFPSSHTMLVCVIMGGAFVVMKDYVKNRGLRVALQIAALAVAALTVVARLMSGVHWLTDIVGGVILSLALVTLYSEVCSIIESKKE